MTKLSNHIELSSSLYWSLMEATHWKMLEISVDIFFQAILTKFDPTSTEAT